MRIFEASRRYMQTPKDIREAALYKLVYVGGKVRFNSEKYLEDYIEHSFETIFPQLTLLRRQYTVDNQRCDLLCVSKSTMQGVIIELKNEEDRYIVTQLTRYREAIVSNNYFADTIDFNQPIELIAIAPIFHKDNYTDKRASKFEHNIQLLSFEVHYTPPTAKFILDRAKFEIPYPIAGLPGGEYNNSLSFEATVFKRNLEANLKDDFVKLRSLLICQPNIKEILSPSGKKILYAVGGNKNSKKLAEITCTSNKVSLFLWLPTQIQSKRDRSKRIILKAVTTRFGIIVPYGTSVLRPDTAVEWFAECSSGQVNLKDKPQSWGHGLKFTRSGVLKWTEGKRFHGQFGRYVYEHMLWNESTTDFNAWFEQIKLNGSTHIGWFVDLAIKAYNYNLTL